MPEGPIIKNITRELQVLEGNTILKTTVVSGRYTKTPINDLAKLEGAKISQVLCKGKLIVFQLTRENESFAALSTMGMAGWWIADSLPYTVNHKRLTLELDNGTVPAFMDQRNFGTFKVVSTSEMTEKLEELGPDILSLPKTWMQTELPLFFERVLKHGKKLTIAEAIMDQRISAGCGNYIRADAMYLIRVRPQRLIAELSKDELYRLWLAMFQIARSSELNCHPCIDLDIDSPHDELNEQLASKPFENLVYGQVHSPLGGKIKTYKDKNGRTVWYSPSEQVR